MIDFGDDTIANPRFKPYPKIHESFLNISVFTRVDDLQKEHGVLQARCRVNNLTGPGYKAGVLPNFGLVLARCHVRSRRPVAQSCSS